jgi:hypothetical protein
MVLADRYAARRNHQRIARKKRRKKKKVRVSHHRTPHTLCLPEARNGVTLNANKQRHILAGTTLNDVTFRYRRDARSAAADWFY